jgi:CheY-like chemotaxis protein
VAVHSASLIVPHPVAIPLGAGALLATGWGIVVAQAQNGTSSINTTIQSGVVGVLAASVCGLIKVWLEQRNIAGRYESEMKRQKEDHDAQLKRMREDADREHAQLRKEIVDKEDKLKKVEETRTIERDVSVIQIQDLKLGEEWLKLQLRVATGKEVPPKPALFTPEAEKVLGSSGIMPSPVVPPPGKDILVVDDSASSIIQLKRLLRYYGWYVRSAVNVAQAMHLIKEKKPDIILTDLLMPGTNGSELVRTIREEGDMTTKIIVLTAYPESNLVADVQAMGVELLEKPYHPQRLLDLITPMEEAKDPSDY